MSLKLVCLLAPVALGGWWFASGSGPHYSRDVDRTPAQVMAALSDLDVREQPGSPGTDPSRSGGVAPLFRTERGANEISFVVMSGNRVATRMIARLEPLDGGRRTRVTAEVVRGDAPDDFVSPAFRSNGITMGLFSAALEGELNELTMPARKTLAECQRLEQALLEGNAPAVAGNPLRTIAMMHAAEAELRRQGCDTNRGGGFQPVSNQMGSATAAQTTPPPRPQPGVSFEAGRPMVDPGSDSR